MRLSKGDAVTYAALVAAAILQALEPFRKEAATPPEAHPFLSSQVWAYLPITLLTAVGIIWLFRQFRPATQITAGVSIPNTNSFVAEPVPAKSHPHRSSPVCDFGKFEWRHERLDPGENYGGPQGFYKLWLPVQFKRNVKSVTIRVSALRPVQPFDRRSPEYRWNVVESKDFLQRDVANVVFATVAENRQNHGYYGDQLSPDVFYIWNVSKHLFEIEVFYDGGIDRLKIYLESPSRSHVANPQDGPGKLAGIIVIQENDSVFEGDWIDESRAAVLGKRKPFKPDDLSIGPGAIGSGPIGS